MAEVIEDAIDENALAPKRVTADGVTVESQNLKDQIEADRYLRAKEASVLGLGGVLRQLASPPGAV